MARAGKSKTAKAANRFYRAAKISEYQFKRVLWAFVQDEPVAEAARHIALSANSINAIYTKLRKFFFEYGLFRDLYKGGDPRQGLSTPGFEDVEHLILLFHLKRVKEKRGKLDSAMDAPDYHFAESNWRFDFHDLKKERGPDAVYRMMYANLLEFIRRFGPVGGPPPTSAQFREGRVLALEQLDRMILWLERNSVKFRSPEERQALRQLREDADP